MSASPHHLFLASAGTGKTFQLTGHFLELLLREVDPGRVLATTFTRKAAGEILDRVLERLVEGALEPNKLEDLNAQLSRPVRAEDCTALLARLVRGLDRFQVRTIDAFFVQVGHLFALDLGLPAGWSIADEYQEERLTREALARMVEELSMEEMTELLRGIARETGAGRRVYSAMQSVIRDGRDTWLDSAPGAWERLSVPEPLSESELNHIEEALRTFELPKTKKGTPVKNWETNVRSILRCFEERHWAGLNSITLVAKVAEAEEDFARVAIPDDFREWIERLQQQIAHVELAALSERNLAHARLFAHFERAFARVERERGLYGFGDLPRALAGPSGEEQPLIARELDLGFRLDARIDHLLLDEFQDTAPQQWRILEPIAEEITSTADGERTFFCVGDVKQSIYGFRSAEPQLLSSLEEWFPGLEPKDMWRSYRSSPVVIDTVNRVFEKLSDADAFQGDKNYPYRTGVWRWSEGFPHHETAREDLLGSAVLIEAPDPGEEGNAGQAVYELAVERVEALVREAPAASIGVLVRTNRPIPGLISRLLARGIGASGEGGNPLTDSRAVLHLISLLHLADHPGDSAAAFHVEHSPLGEALRERHGEDLKSFSSHRVSRVLRDDLFDEGLGLFCASFLSDVLTSADYGEWDRRRFRQAVDLAFAYGPAFGLRADDFVEYLREHKVEDPAASQVKVMTVHASKGLEFDVVVLPELDASLKRSRGSTFYTRRPDPRKPFDLVCVNPGDSARLDGDLTDLAHEHRARMTEEALSVLYVALTRAKRRLEMLVAFQSKPSNALTYANLLRQQFGATPAEDGILWRHPDNRDDWSAGLGGTAVAEAPREPVLRLAPSKGLRGLPPRTPSAHESPSQVLGQQLLARRLEDAAARGTLIHEWLSELEWLEEFEWDEARLLEAGAHLEPDAEVRRGHLAELATALERPGVRTALNRPADEADYEVWRERPFSVLLEGESGESLWTGAFDRVVLVRDSRGGYKSAEVIDYKTDHVEGEALAKRSEDYRSQLERYRRALAAITGLAESRITMSLLFLHAGERCSL